MRHAKEGRLLREIEWKLIEMPLPRLQRVGKLERPLLYRIGWDETIRASTVRRYQRQERGVFDNRILFKPQVGDHLVRLNGVIRPLLLRHWTAMVARINRLEEARLERFLFGAERIALEPVRRALVELQDGRCFYCDGKLAGRRVEVDHFIPWSRYPDDALDNLVAADRRCNNAKRDFLAALPHLRRWRTRLDEPGLGEVAQATGWHLHREATLGVARAIYLRLPAEVPLWERGTEFWLSEPRELAEVLGTE